MKAIGERLRELREAQKVSQGDLGAKLQRNQRWISERERGTVGTTVDEATEIAEAIGYAGEFVVLPARYRELLGAMADADPRSVELAIRLLMAVPHLGDEVLGMVSAMVEQAEGAASRKTGTR